jgi:hypothetical protein
MYFQEFQRSFNQHQQAAATPHVPVVQPAAPADTASPPAVQEQALRPAVPKTDRKARTFTGNEEATGEYTFITGDAHWYFWLFFLVYAFSFTPAFFSSAYYY